MAVSISGATALADDTARYDDEFALDVRVVEAHQPVGGLPLITSDNCGSTCSGTACSSVVSYPS